MHSFFRQHPMSDKDLSVNQRIKFLIENYSQLTQRAFATRIGISQSAISSLFSQRENRPGLDMLQKIAIAYPEISLEWLLLGQGDMTKLMASPSEMAKLELTAKALIDRQERSGLAIEGNDDGTMPDEAKLAELLLHEEELRHRLVQLKYAETGKDQLFPEVELDSEQLKGIAAQKTVVEMRYIQTMYSRMRVERALLRQEVSTNVYRVVGEVDPTKTYGGLLSIRLSVSEETALDLVKGGHIRSVFIDGEGYRVTEQAVREFFGEA
jgi:transcriptional regulator with XRE-family HTH domain